MSEALNFDEEKVAKLEEDFQKIDIDEESKNMVKAAAQLLSTYVPISEMAIMGNGWLSLTEWQVKNKTTIMDAMIGASPERMKEIFTELNDIGRRRMMLMLEDPEGQKELLDEAFDKVLKFFTEYERSE